MSLTVKEMKEAMDAGKILVDKHGNTVRLDYASKVGPYVFQKDSGGESRMGNAWRWDAWEIKQDTPALDKVEYENLRGGCCE